MTTGLPSFPAMDEKLIDTCIRLREIAPVVEVEFPGGVPAYLALTQSAVREVLAGDNKTFLRDPKHWPALHDGSIDASRRGSGREVRQRPASIGGALVRVEGIEPPRLAAGDFESPASTSSAIPARGASSHRCPRAAKFFLRAARRWPCALPCA